MCRDLSQLRLVSEAPAFAAVWSEPLSKLNSLLYSLANRLRRAFGFVLVASLPPLFANAIAAGHARVDPFNVLVD